MGNEFCFIVAFLLAVQLIRVLWMRPGPSRRKGKS